MLARSDPSRQAAGQKPVAESTRRRRSPGLPPRSCCCATRPAPSPASSSCCSSALPRRQARRLGVPRREGRVGDVVAGEPGSRESALRAAVRETREEAGLDLAATRLVAISRWITPEISPQRFDTWFFLGVVDTTHEVSRLRLGDHRSPLDHAGRRAGGPAARRDPARPADLRDRPVAQRPLARRGRAGRARPRADPHVPSAHPPQRRGRPACSTRETRATRPATPTCRARATASWRWPAAGATSAAAEPLGGPPCAFPAQGAGRRSDRALGQSVSPPRNAAGGPRRARRERGGSANEMARGGGELDPREVVRVARRGARPGAQHLPRRTRGSSRRSAAGAAQRPAPAEPHQPSSGRAACVWFSQSSASSKTSPKVAAMVRSSSTETWSAWSHCTKTPPSGGAPARSRSAPRCRGSRFPRARARRDRPR